MATHRSHTSNYFLVQFFSVISLTFAATFAFGEAKVEMINDMVPKGWILVYYALGDINRDGLDDAIMVVENTDNRHLKRNPVLGPRVLNMNPRQMMVLLQTESSYQEVLRIGNGFPTEHQHTKPCLADPLVETGGININDGHVKIMLHYKMNCGVNYNATKHTFNFHYENSKLRLVSFDEIESHTINGDATAYEIDYVHGQKKSVTGINLYEKTKKKTRYQSIPVRAPLYLENISLACKPSEQAACKQHLARPIAKLN